MSSGERKFGDIEFQGKDIAIPAVKFDKLAVSTRSELLMVSLVAESQRIKQVRAILCGGAKATIQAAGVQVSKPGEASWDRHTPGRLLATSEGYQVFTHKLGFSLVHAIFMTRMPGFMKIVTPESLWQELTSTRFTTPLLKEWVPWIEGELRSRQKLEDAYGFNSNCGVLSGTTVSLDEIVTDGLARYKLLIPKPSAA